jgi:CDP-4-dehydro-6-deoxyglucose reductase
MSSSYTIRLQGGLSFICPDHKPILLAALEQGVFLPHACRLGACGRCVTPVLRGRIDRSRQRFGEAHQAQLCRAYPLSDCLLPRPTRVPLPQAGQRQAARSITV